MATKNELQNLARLRFREAEALFAAGLYDGCAYLCGYVVEVALKATICAALNLREYPEKGNRLKEAFKTHDFDDLKLLAGMETTFTAGSSALLSNWSVATEWTPEQRYKPGGTYDEAGARHILEAIRAEKDGVLPCISSRW